ncbi:MAG: hypothetical protein H6Q99_1330 [Proteobacteria bacterium]|nr:hypothetical protein [Pseudomonadota bacterium]
MTPKVIACQVMVNELRSLMPEDWAFESLEIGLHNRPRRLHTALQAAIDAADGLYDPIYLGYGLCAQATVGLSARHSRLVLLRADDCITVFLGSRQARSDLLASDPGSYFLTRGYIGDGTGSVFDDYPRLEKRFGRERAAAVMQDLLGHYRKLVYITMPGVEPPEDDRRYARTHAANFGLDYVEMEGSLALLKQMVEHDWSGDVVMVSPGQPVTLDMMMASHPATCQNHPVRTGATEPSPGD